MQEDMLLGIRGTGTGLWCNLAHKFKMSNCIIVQLAIFGFHEQIRELNMGGSPGDVKCRACDVREAKEGLEIEL